MGYYGGASGTSTLHCLSGIKSRPGALVIPRVKRIPVKKIKKGTSDPLVMNYASLFVFMIEREKDESIVTFVIQTGQPEREDIHFPRLLSAVPKRFSD
jgi:hypothetical protein